MLIFRSSIFPTQVNIALDKGCTAPFTNLFCLSSIYLLTSSYILQEIRFLIQSRQVLHAAVMFSSSLFDLISSLTWQSFSLFFPLRLLSF